MAIPTPITPTASEPTDFPRFASVDTPNGPGGANNSVEPSEGKKDIGWLIGERPPREYFNWIHKTTYQWMTYLDSWVDHWRNQSVLTDNWSINLAQTTGLTLALNPGQVRLINRLTYAHTVEGTTGVTTVVLTDNATNIVYYNATTNAIAASTSFAPANDRIPLYQVVTSAGAISFGSGSSLDLRTPHTLMTAQAGGVSYSGQLNSAGDTVSNTNLVGATLGFATPVYTLTHNLGVANNVTLTAVTNGGHASAQLEAAPGVNSFSYRVFNDENGHITSPVSFTLSTVA